MSWGSSLPHEPLRARRRDKKARFRLEGSLFLQDTPAWFLGTRLRVWQGLSARPLETFGVACYTGGLFAELHYGGVAPLGAPKGFPLALWKPSGSPVTREPFLQGCIMGVCASGRTKGLSARPLETFGGRLLHGSAGRVALGVQQSRPASLRDRAVFLYANRLRAATLIDKPVRRLATLPALPACLQATGETHRQQGQPL